MTAFAFFCTLLWPAGHLPLKGGDQLSARPSPIAILAKGASTGLAGVISPLEGEMAGRPEEGARERPRA
ncbi:MAG: hypothetical protein BGN87_01170 [Rhizobiales bacterium 65-79]|nr:MAG: hypothetical protein BGN87_01170 [Rhizobiales bacterium 65-79]